MHLKSNMSPWKALFDAHRIHGGEFMVMWRWESVHYHSEKLAIAYGLINTPPGSPLCMFKKMEVPGNCQTSTNPKTFFLALGL
jgi:hypothetical protein